MKRKFDEVSAALGAYDREADKLKALNAEAEELLNEGQMLCRERILRKAEITRERMDAMREVAGIFGVDVEKGR